ncbi:MAG TPA: hypothetical protein VE987_02310, partial [Polyangiaceae bacterium]|nr:hypothetical protein [Polyangiaceae bacterium]
MNSPRLRNDLQASPTEEEGVRYFDVSDPRSGGSMRLFEHEWLIARRLDGRSSFDDVARWAGDHVGFQPSPADLAVYVRTLAELGFLDEAPAPSVANSTPASIPNSVPNSVPNSTVAPQPLPRDETSFADLDISITPAPSPPRGDDGRAARNVVEMSMDDDDGSPSLRSDPHGFEPTNPSGPPVMEPVDDRLVAPVVQVAPPAPRAQVASSSTAPSASGTSTVRPAASPRSVAAARPPARTAASPSSGRLWFLVLVLLAVGGGVLYYFVIAPAFSPAHVRVQPAPAPREALMLLASKGKVEKGGATTLSFAEAGKVVDIVPAGTELKPGMALATLDTYAAAEKELADVRDREAFYEAQVKQAIAKRNVALQKQAQAKVEEKKARRLVLEEKVGKARLVATSVATVAEVLAPVGTVVTPGATALKVVDKRMLAAIAVAPADSKSQRVGGMVTLALASGTASTAARVVAVEPGRVKVELLDDAGGAIKAGDEVALVRTRVPNVIKVPLAALAQGQGGADQVFVLQGDVVKARTVTIAGRTSTDALISAGL